MQAQNSYQEKDLKSPINSVVFPVNGFQPSFSATPTFTSTSTTDKNAATSTSNSSAASMLFKSLLSHQDCILKEQATAIHKQCKTEANFSHFQLPDTTLGWMDKIHPNPCQNPMFFGMDYNNSVLGFAEF